MKSGTAVSAEYLQFQSTISFITYLIMNLEPITRPGSGSVKNLPIVKSSKL